MIGDPHRSRASSKEAGAARRSVRDSDLLLRETNHRCSNDLQLVVGLLSLQSQRVTSPEARQALTDAVERVTILARARSTIHGDQKPSIEAALRQVCEALHAQAELRSILVSLQVTDHVDGLTSDEVTALALVTNELATNAIKHAYKDGKPGHIRVTLGRAANGDISIVVDDDGLPLPEILQPSQGGLGLGLARRLTASIGGLFIPPTTGSKAFELRVSGKLRIGEGG
ncbi:sensor histidine kinase [Sphingomonas faeni]|uniref:sensor histidine kinase n=1 Tax=Sphingomonas faeni TaxID=185950 RepID=UPI002784FE75|nr:sensor histidine kinase [Sphingomonas faeni]MDQ0839430.1 two-component sensor histidine kinase [Sphingomonas faeni]